MTRRKWHREQVQALGVRSSEVVNIHDQERKT